MSTLGALLSLSQTSQHASSPRALASYYHVEIVRFLEEVCSDEFVAGGQSFDLLACRPHLSVQEPTARAQRDAGVAQMLLAICAQYIIEVCPRLETGFCK